MSFPAGGGSLETGDYGATASDGSIASLSGRDQTTVTNSYVDQTSSGIWGTLGGGLQSLVLGLISGIIGAILGGFESVIDAITGTVNNDYIADLPIITDHTQSISELTQAYDQLLLQGNAIVFTSNNSYTPAAGVTSIDVIIIAAGGGGSSGSYDLLVAGPQSGGGGGGGGEVHTNIPASVLPVDVNGDFVPIAITVGAGGAGGAADRDVGTGGGNTIFGTGTASLTAGGGNGGAWGQSAAATSGLGGVGMIPGGNGGIGSFIASTYQHPTSATGSVSGYDLHGGGGGGGAGSGESNDGSAGAAGGISKGGVFNANANGSAGSAPSSIVATGGGGGAGGGGGYSNNGHYAGGAGAFPAGGGGGAACDTSGGGAAGAGGNGILYVIEHFT